MKEPLLFFRYSSDIKYYLVHLQLLGSSARKDGSSAILSCRAKINGYSTSMGKGKPNLTEEQKREIIELYKNGVPPLIIGKQFGIYNTSVTRMLRKVGIERNQLVKVPETITNQIIKLYSEGVQPKFIASKFDLDESTICRHLKKNNINIRPGEEYRRKYDINQDFFKELKEESSYFLGLLYADGCLSNNEKQKRYAISLTLKPEDRYMLQKFSAIIYGFDKTELTQSKFGEDGELRDYYKLTFYSKKIYNDLVKYGCIPRKSHKITFPETIVPPTYMSHFIRGYMDGDGCISDNNDRNIVDFVSTEEFLLGLKKWSQTNLNVNFGALQQRHKDRENNTRSMRIGSLEDVVKFLNYLYDDSSIHLQRKYDIYSSFLIKKENIKYKNILKKINVGNYGTDYIPSYKNIVPTKEILQNLSVSDKEEMAKYLTDFYTENGFPYPQYSDDDLIRQFSLVRSADTKSICIDKNLQIFNSTGTNIAKHFAPHFFAVKSGLEKHKFSMLEAFNNKDALNKVILNRLEQNYVINGNMIRQGLTTSNMAFKTSSFNTLIAKFIYEKFTENEDIVYDYSMGFGHRLIAALSLPYKLTYIGTDPFFKTFESNKNIYEFFSSQMPFLNKKVSLHCCGSENLRLEEYAGKVSLAFSSPPYFNQEMYCNDETQAYHKGYAQFINKWWRDTVSNIKFMLKENGTFILNMKERVDAFQIAQDMLGVAFENGFELIDTYNIQLSKNTSFRNKDGKQKYEPIFVLKLKKEQSQ